MKAQRLLKRASDPQKYRPGRVDCPVGELTGYPASRRPPDVPQISRLAEVPHRPAGAERDPGGSGQFDGDLRGGVAAADDEDPLSRVRHAMDVVAGVEGERG